MFYFLKICICMLFFIFCTLSSSSAEAFRLTGALGAFDICGEHAAGEGRVEIVSDISLWRISPFAGAMGTTDSAFYGYGGLLADFVFWERVHLIPSIAAGYFNKGAGKDLGYDLQFRSQIEASIELTEKLRLGAAFSHLSNLGLGDTNPGAESLVGTVSWAF